MSQYKRTYIPGGSYFFTLVAHQRKLLFNTEENISILRNAIKKIKNTRPFNLEAIVILPDHLHCIMQLPENDVDYSSRWREIKKSVSIQIHPESNARNERPVWQRRFWEHTIRDEEDWHRHMDYIHYNPVKHGYVKNVKDWPWSSFEKMVEKGLYDLNWGANEPEGISDMEME